MLNAATAEVIATPAANLADLEGSVHSLVELQRRIAELEKQARRLRSEVKDGLLNLGLRKLTTAQGRTATLVESTSWRGNKEEADKLLDAITVRRIFTPAHSLAVRVK